MSERSEKRPIIDVGGGYDRGYSACPMFWPDRPGSLLLALEEQGELSGGDALDLGCGEGTNAAWLDARGFDVEAVEISRLALDHAKARFASSGVQWTESDVRIVVPDRTKHDLVVAYGLLHCIPEADLEATLSRLQGWTKPDGLLVIVTFNSRSQDLERAHAGFRPTLRTHEWFVDALAGWEVLIATDTDLHESHPDTNIPHHHSITRMVARCPR